MVHNEKGREGEFASIFLTDIFHQFNPNLGKHKNEINKTYQSEPGC
jgi:hypothetical protein